MTTVPDSHTPTAANTWRKPPPWPIDIYNGIVRGDFTKRRGISGYVAQAVCGFIPVIWTLCAARDLIADYGQRDRVGTVLNALSLIPFLGGFPKTGAIIRSIRDIGQMTQASQGIYGEMRVRHTNRTDR